MKSSLVLTCALCALLARPATAATITWDGGGDGALWTDPLNWSDDTLPGPNDSVVIPDPGGQLWVTNASGSITVQNLQCEASLALVGGALTVTLGDSLIQGGLTVAPDRGLTASGSNVTFLATGACRHLTGATLDVNGASYIR